MSAVENKRQFYRLKYPPGARPSVWFSKQRYCVSDVSIVGDVFRFDGHEMVIKLDKGPSFKHMVDEQRYIRSKYPAFYDRLRGKVA
ncbi:PilZ domain-containing protein [Vibrio nereis]|uniref:PilZ domain-containing protein n=1 Tax=Vibrio nereis TaxID=693 RepID=UPI0024941BFB|nr:PilZ domain-containing protein [Vibrio nereis]